MSNWQVQLTFSEGSSNKFWRARVEGVSLYVNYGRIGSDGQTQVKAFGSAGAAEQELAKLEREKRKKGYEDAGEGGGAAQAEEVEEEEAVDEEEEAEEPAATPAPTPGRRVGAAAVVQRAAQSSRIEHADYGLEADGRKIDLRLSWDGATVRTVVVERYASAEEAQAAFTRLKEQMVTDGYQKVPARDLL